MQTRTYSRLNRFGTKQWWWKDVKAADGDEHGPFPSRDDARDAATAARITAKAAAEDKLLGDTLTILGG